MKTIKELTKDADEWFSKYIRLRDSEPMNGEYVGTCITCSKYGTVAWRDETGKVRYTRGWNAGHFVARGNDVIRYDEMNVNLQCAMRCNNMNSGEFIKYKRALRLKYGDEVPEQLEKLAEETTYYKFTREELEQVIADSKEQVKFYEKRM